MKSLQLSSTVQTFDTPQGHATVAFTLDTYSADIEDLDRDAAEAVIGLFMPRSQRGLV